jgi:hypothetical protein
VAIRDRGHAPHRLISGERQRCRAEVGRARADRARLLADDSLAMVGGLLVGREGHPSSWNYGWTMNPVRDAREQVIATLATIAEPGSALLEALRKIAAVKRTSFNLEIKHAAPVGRDVEWVSEALFAIRARRFGELGGYDERFREGQYLFYNKHVGMSRRVFEFLFGDHASPD